MTRARSSRAGQAAPSGTPSTGVGPQFTHAELEALYLLARESYAPSSRYEAQKSAVKKLRTFLGFETP